MGQRLLINIRGTNGSGKTTLVKSFFDETSEPIIKEGKTIAVHFKSYNLIAIGNYEPNKKMGGIDLLKNQEEYFQILEYVLKNYNQNILIEGMLGSTVFSTYFKKWKQYQIQFKILPIILTLLPPPKCCVERVKNRTNNPKFNPKTLLNTYKTTQRNVDKFKNGSMISIPYDNSKHTVEQSKKVLLEIINYYS